MFAGGSLWPVEVSAQGVWAGLLQASATGFIPLLSFGEEQPLLLAQPSLTFPWASSAKACCYPRSGHACSEAFDDSQEPVVYYFLINFWNR